MIEPTRDEYLLDDPTRAWRKSIEDRLEDSAMHRKAQSIQLDGMMRTVEQHGEAIDSIRGELLENTAMTKRIETKVGSVVEFFENATGAFKVLEGLGKLAKPVGYIAAAAASLLGVWAAIKSGFMR